MKLNIRTETDCGMQIRAADGDRAGSPGIVTGYAARFGVESEPLTGVVDGRRDRFIEVIDARAFDEVLRSTSEDTILCRQHIVSELLATRQGGTLRVWTDDSGLAFEAELPDTALGRDTATLLRRGDLRSMSFSFVPAADGVRSLGRGADGIGRVSVDRVAQLRDVSIVSFPAYADASVAMRSYAPAESAPVRRGMSAAIARRRAVLAHHNRR